MADGGDFRPFRTGRRRVNPNLNRDHIGQQSRMLVSRFIHNRMEADGIPETPPEDILVEPGTPTGPPLEQIREVADALKRIGDELDQDERIQRLLDQVPPTATHQTFLNVAHEIFSDGKFNWGRVVTLFYFAYKMAVKALEMALDIVPLIRSVIEWIASFISDYVAPWILERGGWEAIVEYFGTPTTQAVAIFLGGVVLSALYIVWRRR